MMAAAGFPQYLIAHYGGWAPAQNILIDTPAQAKTPSPWCLNTCPLKLLKIPAEFISRI
jgi:hypothetical protein